MYKLGDAGGIPYPETAKYHYDKWYTTTGLTDGNAYKSIRFNVRQDNLLLHWKNSYMEIHGQLVKKTDGGTYAAGDLITFIHNGIAHLFDNVKLTVGGQQIENVNHVGHVSSMIYDVLFARSKAKGDGLQFMWVPDSGKSTAVLKDNKGFAVRQAYVIDAPKTKGLFKFRIPLYMFFGFMENFVALKGYPVEMEFVRGPDYPALFRNGDAVEGKLVFSEMTLNVPIVEPSTALAVESLKGIKDPYPYLFSFRQRHGMFAPVPKDIYEFQQPIASTFFTERPQMVWVGFQNISGTVDQTVNHAIYTNANVETAYVKMNNINFPTTQIKADWSENDNGFFYEMQKDVRANYLQHSSMYTEGNMLDPGNFKELYTIYCFDVSKQEFTLSGNNVTCDLHVRFKEKTSENLRVYIGWFNDRTLELYTDGKPLVIRKHTDSYTDSSDLL